MLQIYKIIVRIVERKSFVGRIQKIFFFIKTEYILDQNLFTKKRDLYIFLYGK